MLTDNPNTKHRKPKKRTVVNGSNRTWSDAQKIEAVQSWLALGNLAITSRILSIPYITLQKWKATEWWAQVVEDLKQQETVVMSARLKKIVDASLSAVEDRLQNGNFIYDNKTQQLVRKQVDLKDAHRVAVDLMGKKDLLEKVTTTPQQEQTDEQRLTKLAEKFATLVTQKLEKPVLEVVEDISDIEPKENTGD